MFCYSKRGSPTFTFYNRVLEFEVNLKSRASAGLVGMRFEKAPAVSLADCRVGSP